MGMAAILLMWPGTFEQTFVPPSERLHMKFDFDQVVSEEWMTIL